MKRILMAAGLLACLFLIACAPEADPPVTDEGETSDVQSTTSDPEYTLPPIVGPVFPGTMQGGIGEITEQFSYTEGDRTVLNVTLTLPVASIEGNTALQDTLSGRLTALREELESEIDLLYQQYLADYKAGREGLTTPSVQVRFELHYFTVEAMSMTYILTETNSDGMVYTKSYHSNLDLRVGSNIRLSALLSEGKTEGLLTLMQTRLTTDPPEGLYDGAIRNLSSLLEDSWYIADGTLSVELEAGAIAPLSSGTVLLTFTEADLADLLSDYGKALL